MDQLPVSAETYFSDFSFAFVSYNVLDGHTVTGSYNGLSNSDEQGNYIGFLMSDQPNISVGNTIRTDDGLESYTVIKVSYARYNGKAELLKAYY